MKAIMFRELSPRELQIYRTGFKNGYRLAETHLIYKSQAMADKIKMREDRERIKKERILRIKRRNEIMKQIEQGSIIVAVIIAILTIMYFGFIYD